MENKTKIKTVKKITNSLLKTLEQFEGINEYYVFEALLTIMLCIKINSDSNQIENYMIKRILEAFENTKGLGK